MAFEMLNPMDSFLRGRAQAGQEQTQAIQNATGQVGLLTHLQQLQQQQQLRDVLASDLAPEAKQAALMKTPAGMGILKQMQDMEHSRQQAELYKAQIGNFGRLADVEARKQNIADQQGSAVNALSDLYNPQAPTWAAQPGIPKADQITSTDAEAIQRVQDATARGEPMTAGVPNQNTVKGLAIQADPKAAVAALIKEQNPAGFAVGSTKVVPGGYLEKQADGSTKFIQTAAPRTAAATMANQAASITPGTSNLRGNEFLATLDPDMKNKVEAVVKYEAPLTTFSARSGGERSAILSLAKQVDPNFNAMKYPVRQQVMTDFTKGKTADNIVALDQAINHMGALDDLGQALKNNDVKLINTVVNRIRDETGHEEVNNFNTAKQAVGTELMRVFRQVNASEVETKAWEARFSASNSPEQIRGALKTGVKLLEGRVNAINNRWNRAFDTNTGYPNLFSPEAADVLNKLGVPMHGMSAPTPNAGGIIPTTALIAPKRAVNPQTGETLELVGGKWHPVTK